MKRETLALTFAEFDAFWLAIAAGNHGIEVHMDGDLGMVFLVGVPH